MQSAIFENARILDGSSDEGEHDRFVRVADGLIKEISDKPIKDLSRPPHRPARQDLDAGPHRLSHPYRVARSPTLLTTRLPDP